MEIWKNINGYNGLYQVSTKGNVRSCSNWKKGKLLAPGITRNGYRQVGLCKDGKVKRFYVHRLLAEAFIPNPYNLPDINHIDSNPSNNSIDNLEWCSESQNTIHAIKAGRMQFPKGGNSRSAKAVLQFDNFGNMIASWKCIQDAAKSLQIDATGISLCCKGKQKTSAGCIWKYDK